LKCTIDTIVLTGGASRMDFVAELCRETFPDVIVQREDNPSHTVSNGLGWVAVSDSNLEYCTSEARKAVDKESSCSISSLKKSLESSIFNCIHDVAKNCTQKWADAPGDELSLHDLQTSITNAMDADDIKAEINHACEGVIVDWKNNLSSVMEKAVNEQVSKLYSESVAKGIIIPADIWDALQAGNMGLDTLKVSKILEGIDVSSGLRQAAQWSTVGAALGVGGCFGILGALIGAAVGMILAALMADDNFDKPRPRKSRQKAVNSVLDKINASRESIMKDFNDSFSHLEDGYNHQIDTALMIAFEIVTLKRFEL